MIKTLHLWKIAALFTALIFVAACNSETSSDQTEVNLQENENTEMEVIEQPENETFYLIPSPEDLFAFAQDGKLMFSANVLNNKDNTSKYNDTKSKELNFGVYTADMAYTAAFNKYQDAIGYLQTIRGLSDEIGISAVFNEQLIKRIESIIESPDSLLAVSSDSYNDIVTYLEKTDRGKSLSLIAAGGWIETIYIVTSLVEKYDSNDMTIQRLADQKLSFSNLILYLEQHKDDVNVKSTLTDLQELKTFYESLEEVQVEKQNKPKKEGQIVVGGKNKIVMTENDFNRLKEIITKLRKEITKN